MSHTVRDPYHSPRPPSPPVNKGNLGFRQFQTQHQKLVGHPPPPPAPPPPLLTYLDSGDRWIQPAETYLTVRINFLVRKCLSAIVSATCQSNIVLSFWFCQRNAHRLGQIRRPTMDNEHNGTSEDHIFQVHKQIEALRHIDLI